jgi:hypothetical protein
LVTGARSEEIRDRRSARAKAEGTLTSCIGAPRKWEGDHKPGHLIFVTGGKTTRTLQLQEDVQFTDQVG